MQDDTFETWMPFWAANEASLVSIESVTRLIEGIYGFENTGFHALLEAVASGEITAEMLKSPVKSLRAPRGKPAAAMTVTPH